MNELTLNDFDDFFVELYGHEPYDWQRRLTEKAVAGDWPDVVDLPTGSGKTACLDVAVFALASQASLTVTERTASRRMFFCVNRRVIVDEAHQRAKKIAQTIWDAERNADETKPVLQRIASELRTISGINDKNIPPLDVLELRGGIYRDNRWARSITQPTIVCTTIDQLGSRLLFRGYGVSPGAAPIQAALIAYDSLVLLDEAHISRPFLQSLRWVNKYLDPARWAERSIGVQSMQVVPMTATPPDNVPEEAVFSLRNEDDKSRENKGLNDRLSCEKPAFLKRVKDVGESAVSEATRLSDLHPAAVGIIVNRVATAKAIYQKLREQHPESVVELVIGSMRPVDRDQQADRLREFVGPERPQVTTQTSFVVATQCLEVGADYDFDVLITECSSLDALRQRFGRLNRAGRPIDTKAVVLIDAKQIQEDHKLDNKRLDPIYGNALTRTSNWLWEHAQVQTTENKPADAEKDQSKKRQRKDMKPPAEIHSVDFGVDAFNEFLNQHGEDGRIPEALLSPSSKLDAPVMLPAYIDLWSQTNPQPVPDPDVSLFIHGPQPGARDVQICWRADLIDDERLEPKDWPDIVSLLPPTSAECMSVPIGRLRCWLLSESEVLADQSDLLVTSDGSKEENGRLRTQGVLWKGAKESAVFKSANDLYPGCTVVLPTRAQGWNELGHIPEQPYRRGESETRLGQSSKESASDAHQSVDETLIQFDVAEQAFFQANDRTGLRLHRSMKPLIKKYPSAERILDRIADVESPPSITELRGLVRDFMKEVSVEGSLNASDIKWEFYPDRRGLVITTRNRRNRATDWYLPSLDDGEDAPSQALRRKEISLSDHTAHVVAEAKGILHSLPFGDFEAACIIAAELHDCGKADERFQAMLRRTDRSDAWLYAGESSMVLAKSDGMPLTRAESEAARIRTGLPKGFRHEMLSTQIAEQSPLLPEEADMRDLILHLIASHHGYARPFAPVVIDNDAPDVSVEDIHLSGHERMKLPPHRLDSGIAERYWKLTKRLGWWGLAYLESVLRLADQQASARENDGAYPDQDLEPEANDEERVEVSP